MPFIIGLIIILAVCQTCVNTHNIAVATACQYDDLTLEQDAWCDHAMAAYLNARVEEDAEK